MKNVKPFISLMLAILLCVMLAGCSTVPVSLKTDWSDGTLANETAPPAPANDWEDGTASQPTTAPTHDWEDPSDTGSDWEDPGKSDWEDPVPPGPDWEDPGRTDWEDPVPSTQPEQPEQPTEYRHEIDGCVFYTTHNVDDWISGDVFHATEMLRDIFGNAESNQFGLSNATFVFNETTYILAYEVWKNDGSSTSMPGEGAYPHFAVDSYVVYEWSTFGDLYLIDDSTTYIPYELLELSLYACEQLYAGTPDQFGELYLLGHHIDVARIG